eukprot:gene11215-11364_t
MKEMLVQESKQLAEAQQSLGEKSRQEQRWQQELTALRGQLADAQAPAKRIAEACQQQQPQSLDMWTIVAEAFQGQIRELQAQLATHTDERHAAEALCSMARHSELITLLKTLIDQKEHKADDADIGKRSGGKRRSR